MSLGQLYIHTIKFKIFLQVTIKSDIMSFGLMFYYFFHFEIEFNDLNISASYNIIDQNLINFHQSITKSSNYLDRVIKVFYYNLF